MPATLTKIFGYRAGREGGAKMFREADNQTYVPWDFVYLASKRVTILVTAGNNYSSTTGYRALGIVKRPARNTTNPGTPTTFVPGQPWGPRDVPVFPLFEDTEILLPLYDSTLATSAPYSSMQPGDTCTLRNQAGIWCADIGVTANPSLVMVSKEPGIFETDTFSQAWFKVVAACRAYAL